jgi:hypothetical protein
MAACPDLLFACFVLANLFFVWAAIKAERYSVIGGIPGFWLVALWPWYRPLLDRVAERSALITGSSYSKSKTAHFPLVAVVIAGVLLLWAVYDWLARNPSPSDPTQSGSAIQRLDHRSDRAGSIQGGGDPALGPGAHEGAMVVPPSTTMVWPVM